MSAMKDLVMDIVEMYDEQGLTVVQIAEIVGMNEMAVLSVITEYSQDFNTV